MSERAESGASDSSAAQRSPALVREVGVFGAVMMGLGSIIGTGVFVSIGVAAGVAGPAVVPAIALAAVVAAFNALNSAQLAASHPVSGGTYEYGYRYLRPWLGFSAGWMFLCAKSASAATAALGFSGYLLNALGSAESNQPALVVLAVATVVLLTIVVLSGIRRSNRVNCAIVSITLLALAVFALAGLPLAFAEGTRNLLSFSGTPSDRFGPSFLQATALMFVAYTGYGRIATLGEEVREPRKTIPAAMLLALGFSAALYITVATVAIAAVGAEAFGAVTGAQAAPLEAVARRFFIPGINRIVALGAMTAMLGVLLNLLLGLSRVLLAMGRRGDMPAAVSRLNAAQTTPYAAVIAVSSVIVGLTLIGNVKITWSFSAFTVLIYYAVTNLAALFMPDKDRLYGRWIAWVGIVACLFLAFWVEPAVWISGLAILTIGLSWHFMARRIREGNNARSA